MTSVRYYKVPDHPELLALVSGGMDADNNSNNIGVIIERMGVEDDAQSSILGYCKPHFVIRGYIPRNPKKLGMTATYENVIRFTANNRIITAKMRPANFDAVVHIPQQVSFQQNWDHHTDLPISRTKPSIAFAVPDTSFVLADECDDTIRLVPAFSPKQIIDKYRGHRNGQLWPITRDSIGLPNDNDPTSESNQKTQVTMRHKITYVTAQNMNEDDRQQQTNEEIKALRKYFELVPEDVLTELKHLYVDDMRRGVDPCKERIVISP